MIIRLADNVFDDKTRVTLIDERVVQEEYKKNLIRFRYTDTAGQERFKCLTSSFYRDSSAYVFVYYTSERTSVQDLDSFYVEAQRYSPEALKVIVGTKTDISNNKFN